MIRSSVILLLIACSLPCWADPPAFRSGLGRVALVELFTSQGCSSCPPADEWLSGLAKRPGLWSEFVPLAWHVDYWDYLGWRDPFGSARFSARQRDYQRAGGLSVVYTPGVLVNGSEWRDWRKGAEIPSRAQDVGRLTLERSGDQAFVKFEPIPGAGHGPWRAELATLGVDLKTRVSGGENSGHTLEESFVVLSHQAGTAQVGAAPHWRLRIPRAGTAPPRALAVWISHPGDPTPVQATGGRLD